jgi:hypothetical protein
MRFALRSQPPNQLVAWLILFQFPPNDEDSLPFKRCERTGGNLFYMWEPFEARGSPTRRQHDEDLEPIAHFNVPLCGARKCVDHECDHVWQR